MGAFDAWLHKAVTNTAYDHFKKSKKETRCFDMRIDGYTHKEIAFHPDIAEFYQDGIYPKPVKEAEIFYTVMQNSMSEASKNNAFDFTETFDIDSAWNDMRMRLDKSLPIDTRNRKRPVLQHYFRLPAMMLLILSLGIMGNIKFGYYNGGQLSAIQQMAAATVQSPTDEVASSTAPAIKERSPWQYEAAIPNLELQSNGNLPWEHAGKNTGLNTPHKSRPEKNRFVPGSLNEITGQDEILHVGLRRISTPGLRAMNSMDSKPVTPAKISALQWDPPLASTLSMGPAKGKDEAALKRNLIKLEIGAYHTIGGGFGSIYPELRMAIPLSKKASLSLGAGINAQVSTKGFVAKEFVVLNDTVNRAYFTVEEKNIRTASYLDLPMMLHYNAGKNFAFGVGVQLSILQSIKLETANKTFDFQTDLNEQISISPPITTGTFTPHHFYRSEYAVMKTNGRFVTEAAYLYRNLGFRLRYQQSFTPNYQFTDFDGRRFTKKLAIFTIGFSYRIQ